MASRSNSICFVYCNYPYRNENYATFIEFLYWENGKKMEKQCQQTIDIDKLLGEPIQKKIETDSGLKTTLESILAICSGNDFSFFYIIRNDETTHTIKRAHKYMLTSNLNDFVNEWTLESVDYLLCGFSLFVFHNKCVYVSALTRHTSHVTKHVHGHLGKLTSNVFRKFRDYPSCSIASRRLG